MDRLTLSPNSFPDPSSRLGSKLEPFERLELFARSFDGKSVISADVAAQDLTLIFQAQITASIYLARPVCLLSRNQKAIRPGR